MRVLLQRNFLGPDGHLYRADPGGTEIPDSFNVDGETKETVLYDPKWNTEKGPDMEWVDSHVILPRDAVAYEDRDKVRRRSRANTDGLPRRPVGRADLERTPMLIGPQPVTPVAPSELARNADLNPNQPAPALVSKPEKSK